MPISAAGGKLSISAAAAALRNNLGQISAQIANRQHTSTAVLATTGLNFLNYGFSAVARDTSYC